MIDARAARMAQERFGLEVPATGPSVPPERLLEFARALRDELGFGYLSYITAFHHPGKPAEPPAEGAEPAAPQPARFTVVYRVRCIAENTEFAFRCETPVGASVPSLFPVWAGADWQEREAFDLVGPVFADHPDLRRIMLPEDWDGHPLQKQYAIDTPHRPWR